MNLQEKPYLRQIKLRKDQIISVDSYPFNIPEINLLDSMDFHPDVTFFVGENGSGKSTLIEAIAIALGFNAEGGTKQSTFSTARTHSELNKCTKSIKSFKMPIHVGKARLDRSGGTVCRVVLPALSRCR